MNSCVKTAHDYFKNPSNLKLVLWKIFQLLSTH